MALPYPAETIVSMGGVVPFGFDGERIGITDSKTITASFTSIREHREILLSKEKLKMFQITH